MNFPYLTGGTTAGEDMEGTRFLWVIFKSGAWTGVGAGGRWCVGEGAGGPQV